MSKPDFEGPRCCEPTKREVERHAGSVAGLFAKVAAGTGTGRDGGGAGGGDGTTGDDGDDGDYGRFGSVVGDVENDGDDGRFGSRRRRRGKGKMHTAARARRLPNVLKLGGARGGGTRAGDPTQRSVAGFFKPSG